MNRIVIFGATGNTGLCALNSAVNKGLNIKVFVRDENKVPMNLKNKIEIIIGDVTNKEQVSNAISNTDAVVVVLGTRNDLSPTTILSTGMKNIIDAMKMHSVEVVSVCLSAFLFYKPETVPNIFKDLNADHQRMFDLLKESQLKWIAVLPPHIADVPNSKYIVKYNESPGRAISKHDLGAFLIESLQQTEHYQKVCGIANTA
ncbi:flavin reductase (NADPH) isoform X1 [Apis mellifera caucasica]|uniref:Flavin reductase (NADPH) isoform X1 n=1 Tax=Apis mellifera TaxID=7460 RepID=A0A7M7R7R9_APIME|nr:flavin reductase (NADPH) isoform X1 [Apis mellifera]KAG6801025.1 flavin reductase (NADPH) isoform X1 [Apis mellifera caucasica]KAG9433850.1 flavin reductase (NADPH) isoform X1 [Apis mellifera carnica]|eukprot:XP_395902.2 flavin reductase (NADPH) isoform X1 [Apis mellifera]